MSTEDSPPPKSEDYTFSKPWNDSDVVLVVEDKEFHVHRFILSLQSPVFKAMFNGNFKDARQDKIELKDENHEAVLDFLKLLYPPNMLDDDEDEVDINDENILQILKVADKYKAINVIKQCIKEAGRVDPDNTMRLLPYAARHDLPVKKLLNIITRNVSTKKLENFAPELERNASRSLYDQCLLEKCQLLEDVTKRADTMILVLLKKYVAEKESQNSSRKQEEVGKCIQHEALNVDNFKEARKCNNCLAAYRKYFIDKYIYPSNTRIGYGARDSSENETRRRENETRSLDLIDLLEHTNDIATSLQS